MKIGELFKSGGSDFAADKARVLREAHGAYGNQNRSTEDELVLKILCLQRHKADLLDTIERMKARA